MQINKT